MSNRRTKAGVPLGSANNLCKYDLNMPHLWRRNRRGGAAGEPFCPAERGFQAQIGD
jgi:hypothetical protein